MKNISQVRYQVVGRVGYQVRDQVGDQVRDRIWNQTWNLVVDRVRDQAIKDLFEDHVWRQAHNEKH